MVDSLVSSHFTSISPTHHLSSAKHGPRDMKYLSNLETTIQSASIQTPGTHKHVTGTFTRTNQRDNNFTFDESPLKPVVSRNLVLIKSESSQHSKQGSLRKKSSLENMPKAEKEDLFKWILRELEEHKLVTSRLIHQVVLSKSDFDLQRREVIVIKDTVSTKKRDVVERFLASCRHKLKEHVDEASV